LEDKAIIALLFSRSEQGLKAIEEKYDHLIDHMLAQVLSSKEDSNECKNDVYLALWDSIPPNDPEYFKAYICKVARNVAIRKAKMNNAYKRSAYDSITLDELGDSIAVAGSPEEVVEAKELSKYLNLYLEKLNEKDRMMFIRRYFFGDSVEEISKRFNMIPNTASVKLSRLRKSLKEYLIRQEVYM